MIEGSSTWSTMILNILTQTIYQDQPNAFKDHYKSHTHARTHTHKGMPPMNQLKSKSNLGMIKIHL